MVFDESARALETMFCASSLAFFKVASASDSAFIIRERISTLLTIITFDGRGIEEGFIMVTGKYVHLLVAKATNIPYSIIHSFDLEWIPAGG